MTTKMEKTEKNKKPVWLKLSEKELIEIIKDLSKTHSAPKIGIILRDQYGVPTTRVYGKKLSAYLKDLGVETNIDLENTEKKLENIRKHLKKNITDRKAKHKLQKSQSRVNKLKKYYSKK